MDGNTAPRVVDWVGVKGEEERRRTMGERFGKHESVRRNEAQDPKDLNGADADRWVYETTSGSPSRVTTDTKLAPFRDC